MKWLAEIDTQDFSFTSRFDCDSEEEARKKAIKLFDSYVSDSGRDFDEDDVLPVVMLYQIADEIGVDVSAHYFKQKEEQQERWKKHQEADELAHYERLQKKFGAK